MKNRKRPQLRIYGSSENIMFLEFDGGSFKDREGRVGVFEGRVFRTLSSSARKRMEHLTRNGTLEKLIDDGLIVPTWLTETSQAGLDSTRYGEVIMEHAPVPMVSYPFEWSFDMLRDASLLTLDLLERCLQVGLTLKDATPYNVMFFDGKMKFIDALSLDVFSEGEPWIGYAQFCREFLYPLVLTSFRNVEFQPWIRGAPSGIRPQEITGLLGKRHWFRRGIFPHVLVQAHLERAFGKSDVDVKSSFTKEKFPKRVILKTIASLRKMISELRYSGRGSEWANYDKEHSYENVEARKKATFVEEAIRDASPTCLVDVGCNAGVYSLPYVQHAGRCIGLDADPACINSLYLRIKRGEVRNYHPLVVDVLNPTPNLGWNLKERRDIGSRIGSDFFIALALVHHICISGNVPIRDFVQMLSRLGNRGVVEWVSKEDPMVQRMLRNRVDVFSDYNYECFYDELANFFDVVKLITTHRQKRSCFLLKRRS